MGINNKKRRAAKQRKRARQQSARSSAGRGHSSEPRGDEHLASYAAAESQISDWVRATLGQDADDFALRRCVGAIAASIAPAPATIVTHVVLGSLFDLILGVMAGGWSRVDLEDLVRRTHASWLPVLGTALDAVDAGTIDLERTDPRLLVAADGLGLVTLLCDLPLLDADAVAASRTRKNPGGVHPKWHQVRALLAKAEATEFGPEAEALMAKAQELISKHALERLVAAEDGETQVGVSIRRLWLDKPYLSAKAVLVGEVARANRCRSAFAERYQFSIVIGDEVDQQAVELLVTSLLLQADTAMYVQGRARSSARSRSFRQSFLMAYSTRIGERLRAVGDSVAEEQPNALPVLHEHESRVAEAFFDMVPTERGRPVNVTDADGWNAGTAAADLATLDVRERLSS